MDSSTVTSSRKALHVLVIAHPDDESMFFLPTIHALTQSENQETLWILCLTTGDYDGLGKIREKEMHNAGKLLGASKVIVNNTLQDHPTARWSIPDVHKDIQETLQREVSPEEWGQIVLITFDSLGVSGHVNHIDTYLGVCSLVKSGSISCGKSSVEPSNQRVSSNSEIIPLQGWTLQSESNMVHKYFPLYCWILLLFTLFLQIPQERAMNLQLSNSSSSNQNQAVVFRMHQPQINWLAMQTHHSQFVWYRRLFVIFSCYTYVNSLQSIRSA